VGVSAMVEEIVQRRSGPPRVQHVGIRKVAADRCRPSRRTDQQSDEQENPETGRAVAYCHEQVLAKFEWQERARFQLIAGGWSGPYTGVFTRTIANRCERELITQDHIVTEASGLPGFLQL
jgi:hypothetical protein